MTAAINGDVQYLRLVADKLRARRLARTGNEPKGTAAAGEDRSHLNYFPRLVLLQSTIRPSPSRSFVKRSTSSISGNVQYWRSAADKLRARRLARTGQGPKETAAVRGKPIKRRWIVTRKGLHLQRPSENRWLRPLPSLPVPPCFQGAYTHTKANWVTKPLLSAAPVAAAPLPLLPEQETRV